MKRDVELLRMIVLDLRDGRAKTEFSYENREFQPYAGVNDETLYYHYELLAEQGLIRFNPKKTKDGVFFLDVPKLTSSGHDYADTLEDETIWEKTKDAIKEKGKDITKVSLDVLLAIAKAKATEYLSK